jgi:hypothetical protein
MVRTRSANASEPLEDWDPKQRLLKSPYDKTSLNLRRPLNAKLLSLQRLLEDDFDVDQSKLLNFLIFIAEGSKSEFHEQYRRFRAALAGDCELLDPELGDGQSGNVLPIVRYHRPGPRQR